MSHHVKHLGFELELKVLQIVRALAWVPRSELKYVIDQLTPVGLRRAVAEQLGVETK